MEANYTRLSELKTALKAQERKPLILYAFQLAQPANWPSYHWRLKQAMLHISMKLFNAINCSKIINVE